MKRPSRTYLTTKKYVATVCATGLLLFTLSASAGLITFDSLGSPDEGDAVPSGYEQLQWDNFYAVNGNTNIYNPSGYQRAIVSKNNVAFNGFGNPASIFVGRGGSFTPLSAYATAAWNDNLQLHVEGFLRGRRVFTHTYKLSAIKPTVIKLGGVRMDELVFTSSGGTPHFGSGGENFAMDNLQITRVNPGVVLVPSIEKE